MKIPWWGWYLIVVTTVVMFFGIGLLRQQEKQRAWLAHVRAQCHVQAIKNAQENGKSKYNWTNGVYLPDDYESYYKECLRSYGIDEKDHR